MYLPILAKEDYFQRINDMQNKVNEKDLDAVIIFANEAEPANVRYFTNYRPIFETTALIIPRIGDPVILTGPETEELVREHSMVENHRKLIEFRETSDPDYPDIKINTFQDVFSELNDGIAINRVGLIGQNLMTVQVYKGIILALPADVVIENVDNLLRQIRMMKTKKELEVMNKAAQIAGKGFEYALEHITPGMTELQVVAKCIAGVFENGAEGTGFPIWCLSGKGTNQAIGIPTQRIIKKDEVIQISMGAMLEGYVSSFGRPFVFGNINSEVKKMMDVALEANELTHSLLRPGYPASDVAKKVRELICKRGLEGNIVYGPAHGIGMMECEYPFIETTSDFLLEENMAFAVDTFLAGKDFGMRYEDTVAITSEGEQQFCNFKREIINLS